MKAFWNERYAEDGFVYGKIPNAYLTEVVSEIKNNGSVLVVGDGEGRNGVWLAKQGFDVTCVDYSTVAIEKINNFAKTQKVGLATVCADMSKWDWPVDQFDAVVSIYVHFLPEIRKSLHIKMIEALKPGGVILMEAFNKDQLQYKSGGPPVLEMLFSKEIIEEDFSSINIVTVEEKIVQLNEGKYHCGDGAVVRLIARK